MNAPAITHREPCLRPSGVVDSDHELVGAYVERHTAGCRDDRTKAVALYYAVRDGIRYDPYSIHLSPQGLRASATLAAGRGWCVSKSILLTACCRAARIPAGLGFADVQNHLSTERLRRVMGTDVFVWHGYSSIWLEDRWVKATPAFNRELCDKFRILPLEFDGREDSIFHAFDREGREHMEYLAYRGEFAEVPIEAIQSDFAAHYPSFMKSMINGNFDREVAAETGAD